MEFDLQDAHPSLREELLKDDNYLATQDLRIIEFYKTNGVNAKYVEPRKAVLPRGLCHIDD